MKKHSAPFAVAGPIFSAFSLSIAATSADEMRLDAATGLKAPIIDLAKDFEKASGHRIILLFYTADAAEQKFLADSDATFLLPTQTHIRDAEKTASRRAVSRMRSLAPSPVSPQRRTKPNRIFPSRKSSRLRCSPRHASPSQPPHAVQLSMYIHESY